jgi:Uma2 family endonuclease
MTIALEKAPSSTMTLEEFFNYDDGTDALAIAMEGAKRSTVMAEMPPPLLVVEVVSPNQSSRDYRYKRSEYAARGIAEYWIVDPIVAKVTVLEWVDGLYEEQVYVGDQEIKSLVFSDLKLTAAQVLLVPKQD